VTVNTSGETINAIACKAANHSTITGPVVYTLNVTPASVVGTPTAACPSVVAVGFETSAADTNLGGPTPTANICYSRAPIAAGAACGNAAGITCFTPTAAIPTQNVSLIETGNIYTLACKPNFTGTHATLPVTVAPYAPPTITVDGVLNAAEWTPALGDQFPGGGGFTFGKTTVAGDTLFFSQSGFTAAANTNVIFYVTDVTEAPAANTTTAVRLVGAGALPFAAQYAIEIATNTGVVTTYSKVAAVAGWSATAFPVTAAVNAVDKSLEASAVISTLPGMEAAGDTFDIAGEVATGAVLSGGWSLSDYSTLVCSPLQSL
jgi:hypothetical protein